MNSKLGEFYKDLERAKKLGIGIGKIDKERYEKVVICGIGGSAIPGEVISVLDLKIPVVFARENLPSWVDEKTLCFIVSYSGNTAETINLYKEAKKRKCQIIIVTSGGKLGKLKEKIVRIPGGYEPREAVLFLLIPVLNILGINVGKIKLKKVNENEVKKLAVKLIDRIPIIYASSENLRPVALRWQDDLNENSKVLAHSNYFPELCHNEIEADIDKNMAIILLIDKSTSQIKKAKEILKKENFSEIKLIGRNLIEKMLYGIYYGDLLSVCLAELRGRDYTKIPKIDIIKGKK